MKKTSCGFIVFNTEDRMLACHPAGREYTAAHCFDIPKGNVDSDENALETAKRELYEETGLTIPDGTGILSLGKFSYRPEKDLILFAVKMDIDESKLKCTSTFELNGKQIPEMDSYILTYDESKFFKSLLPIIHDISERNDVREYLRSYKRYF